MMKIGSSNAPILWQSSTLFLLTKNHVTGKFHRRKIANMPGNTTVSSDDNGEDDPSGYSGKVIANRYLVEKLTNTGGQGVVYRGRDNAHNSVVCLKRMKTRLKPDAVDRWRCLGDNPSVINLLEVLTEEGIDWLVMPWIQGNTLESHLQKIRQYGDEERSDELHEILRLIVSLSCDVAEANREGVIHNDLNIKNVMRSKAGNHLWIVDWTSNEAPAATADGQSPNVTLGMKSFRSSAARAGDPFVSDNDIISLCRLTWAIVADPLDDDDETALNSIDSAKLPMGLTNTHAFRRLIKDGLQHKIRIASDFGERLNQLLQDPERQSRKSWLSLIGIVFLMVMAVMWFRSRTGHVANSQLIDALILTESRQPTDPTDDEKADGFYDAIVLAGGDQELAGNTRAALLAFAGRYFDASQENPSKSRSLFKEALVLADGDFPNRARWEIRNLAVKCSLNGEATTLTEAMPLIDKNLREMQAEGVIESSKGASAFMLKGDLLRELAESKDDYTVVFENYKRGLEIRQKVLPSHDPLIGHAMVRIGRLHGMFGSAESGQEWMSRAITSMDDGGVDPLNEYRLAAVADVIRGYLINEKAPGKVVELVSDNLSHFEQVFGKNSEQTLMLRNFKAAALFSELLFVEAQQEWAELIDLLPNGNERLSKTKEMSIRCNYAICCTLSGNPDSLPNYIRADTLAADLPNGHPGKEAVIFCGALLHVLGDETASDQSRAAFETLQSMPKFPNGRECLGTVILIEKAYAQGDRSKCLKLLDEFPEEQGRYPWIEPWKLGLEIALREQSESSQKIRETLQQWLESEKLPEAFKQRIRVCIPLPTTPLAEQTFNNVGDEDAP